MSIVTAARSFRDDLDELRRHPGAQRGVATGIPGLDAKLSFGAGDLVTVASRTSMGKTSLLLSFIQAACEQHMASKGAQAVAVVTADMPAVKLVQRNSNGEVDYGQLERPTIMRKHAVADRHAPVQESDLEYLDIPAFLRRQAD